MLSDPAIDIVLKELQFDVLTMVEMSDDIVCLGLIDKYNTLAAIQSRRGNVWTFKCLGEAHWVIDGHHRVVAKVEGTGVSTLCWTMDNVTFVRASLTDYKEIEPVGKTFWEVEVVF